MADKKKRPVVNEFSPRAMRDMAYVGQTQTAAQDALARQAAALEVQMAPAVGGVLEPGYDDPNVRSQAEVLDAVQMAQARNRDLNARGLPPTPMVTPDPTKSAVLPSTSRSALMTDRQRQIYRARKARPKQKKA